MLFVVTSSFSIIFIHKLAFSTSLIITAQHSTPPGQRTLIFNVNFLYSIELFCSLSISSFLMDFHLHFVNKTNKIISFYVKRDVQFKKMCMGQLILRIMRLLIATTKVLEFEFFLKIFLFGNKNASSDCSSLILISVNYHQINSFWC